MQIITHYKNTHVHCQDVATVSVANELGLTIEFMREKARDYYLEKFLKQRIPVQTVGPKTICPASDGFTVFNDGVGE